MESGLSVAAVYSADAEHAEGVKPNPLASMGRNEADTGNASFLSDPTRAIMGNVLIMGTEGEDLTDEEVESVHKGIRAVENYKSDYPDEFQLWSDAAVNLRKSNPTEDSAE